jgi:hypothetical protein
VNPPDPVHVFISSDEDEFSPFRGRLKNVLESLEVVNMARIGEEKTGSKDSRHYQPLIIPEVVEYGRGTNIERKMRIAMNKSQLYVGLFGTEHSARTEKEFNGAVDRGMTTLVYYYAGPQQTLKSLDGTNDRVHEFLMEEVKPKTLILGNYKSIQIKSLEELENEIVSDIVAELTNMVRQCHAVQRALSGFQD